VQYARIGRLPCLDNRITLIRHILAYGLPGNLRLKLLRSQFSFCFLRVRVRALAEHAPVIFFADELEDLPGGVKLHLEVLRPWSRENFGIVDGDLIGHRRWIDESQMLDHVQLIAVYSQLIGFRVVCGIEHPFLDSNRVDDERVAVPSSDRVAHPRRLDIF
jgi:hypothetical protein